MTRAVVLGARLSAFFVLIGFGLPVGCGRRRRRGFFACPALFSGVCWSGGCGRSQRVSMLFPKISFATYAVLGLAEIAAVHNDLFGVMSALLLGTDILVAVTDFRF